MKKSSFALLLFFSTFCAEADDANSSLEKYGKQLAGSTKNNAITLVSVTETMEQPMIAYVLQFKTASEELMSEPNAEENEAAYWRNLGKTEVWSAKFCTVELKKIMTEFKIDMVSGDLTDMQGDTQRMSLCSPRS